MNAVRNAVIQKGNYLKNIMREKGTFYVFDVWNDGLWDESLESSHP